MPVVISPHGIKEERERLNCAQEGFESTVKVLEKGIAEMHSFRSISEAANHPSIGNGKIKGGTVVPPNPHNPSSNSNPPRRRRRGP
jgi:hypothetical protein